MSRTAHVVIVEDDTPVRRALARLLSAAGFEVSNFRSAEEFLAALPDLKPACLLLDVHLPGLSGPQLDRLLGRLAKSVPTVFITGDHEWARNAESSAGPSCLTKPIDSDALLTAIASAIGRS